jgi:hypothetical protein
LFVTTGLLAGLYAWLGGRLVRCGLHGSLAGVLVGLTLAASAAHFHVRPHVLTLLFFGWTFAALCAFEAGRIGLGKLLWLVPLCGLWANLHGGVVGALGTLALAFLGWTAARWFGIETPLRTGRQALAFAGLGLACGVAVLINPYGVQLPQVWWELLRSPVLPRVIREHAPLDLTRLDGLMTLMLAGVYLVALAGLWPGRPRVAWLLPLAWLLLAGARVRHAPLFGVAVLVALPEFLPRTRWARWLAARGDLFRYPAAEEPPRPAVAGLPWLVPAGGVLAAVLLVRGWARLDPAYWPMGLRPELERYAASRAGATPIFNDYPWGGFLIYFTPSLRVFIDGRCEVYGPDWLDQYDTARRQHPERIEDWARRYGFDRALVEAGPGFDDYLRQSPDWVAIGRTPAAALYARRLPPGDRP